MGLSDLKTSTRLALHARMGEPCLYQDEEGAYHPTADQVAAGLSLNVRWSNKSKVMKDDTGLTLWEQVEKLIFNATELASLGLTLEPGGRIEIPGYQVAFVLDQPFEPDGPENVYWMVVRD
jgi:hypothetical protein